jgi:glyoxylase-like metal-dependent hydrolase (beta-lactamase superfamily II)
MRTLRSVVVVVVAAMLIAFPVAAQRPSPRAENVSLSSARRARAVIDAGIEAVGGMAALQAPSDLTRYVTRVRTDWGQGLTPDVPARNHGGMRSIRDFAGQRFADARYLDITGGQVARFVTAVTPAGAFNANLQVGTYRNVPPPAVVGIRASLLRRDPESLLLAANARAHTLRFLGKVFLDGSSCDVVSFADSDGELVTLYLDATTHRLARSEWLTDDPVLGDVTAAISYRDHQTLANGPTLPRRYVEFLSGDTLQDSRVTSIVVDSRPADSLFAPPAGAVVPQGVPTPGAPLKLAEDVYAIPGVYSSLIVVFHDYVLVLEAGDNSRATENTIRQVKTLAPGKPIRYLISTHHHYDHLGGIRTYIAGGVTIVTTPDAKRVIEGMATAPHRLRPDALATHPRLPVIETVEHERTFEDADHTVRLYEIGPTPHVAQMLIAYLPREKILFEGDLLDIPDGRPAPGGDDTAQLAAAIDSLHLDVTRIVPVHGAPGTIDDLRAALLHRATVHSYESQPQTGNVTNASPDDERAVLAVLHDWLGALQRADSAALRHIIAEDYAITLGDGRVLNRDQDLAPVVSRRFRFVSATVDSVRVRFFGAAAVVTGVGSYVVSMGDRQSALRERFTDVYAFRGGRWQPVASHSSPLRN